MPTLYQIVLVRRLNDTARSNPGTDCIANVISGFHALPDADRIAALTAIVAFTKRDGDNDLYGEHDLALLWQVEEPGGIVVDSRVSVQADGSRATVVDEGWRGDLERWLEPARRRMCPQYVAGLIGPGDRKSVQPMATRGGEVGYGQLHHFVAAGVWDSAPLQMALLSEADRLVGGAGAFLVIDDTAMPKKGRHSVGVAPQYAASLGKNANCQTMVSVMLASREMPVMVGLRLFLPESWTVGAASDGGDP